MMVGVTILWEQVSTILQSLFGSAHSFDGNVPQVTGLTDTGSDDSNSPSALPAK